MNEHPENLSIMDSLYEPKIRALFRKDKTKALQELGLKAEQLKEIEVKIYFSTAETTYIPVPVRGYPSLTSQELNLFQGGGGCLGTGGTFSTLGTASTLTGSLSCFSSAGSASTMGSADV